MAKIPPRRKRLTREQQKEQTRRRLLESGAELFARLGYEGPSVEEIAEHAGYSRGAFYSNFRNKEALMEALIAEGFDSDLEDIRSMAGLEDADSLAAAYAQLGRAFAGDQSNVLWMLEFQLSAVRHEELRAAYLSEHRKMRTAVQDVVVSYFRRHGHPDPEQFREYGDVFLALLPGLGLFKLLYGHEIDEELFGKTFRALLEGMNATQ